MNDENDARRTNPFSRKRRERSRPRPSRGAKIGYLLFLAIAFFPAFIWFGCRIEPRSGEMAVLTRKTGKDLPTGQILALEPGQKGIQQDVLPEGRYFRNPYSWDWEIDEMTDIPAGKLGVKTRLYGKELPPGKIIAAEGYKGISADVLRPGKYRFNPYAFHIHQFNAITIRPGHVGVITALIGFDVLNDAESGKHKNDFLVDEGTKGVISRVLDPGTYYLNPYMYNVVEVNLRGQRFEMSGKDVISFLTVDGFTVTVEGTIEFAISRDSAALVTHRVGDMDDVVKKVILPRARGFSRIEGSKHPAINFIVGETRQAFQNDLEAHLREKCKTWGVDVRSVLVRKIEPPDEIASINRDREVAVQEANKFIQQIEQAKSKAELTKQEMLAVQNKEKVMSDTERIRAVINAQQDQEVKVIAANKELEVAQINLEASRFQAQAVILTAEGGRDAIKVKNVAEADVMSQQVKAFDSGMNLARYVLYQRVGPQVQSVLTSDGKGGLGDIFTPFLPGGKAVDP